MAKVHPKREVKQVVFDKTFGDQYQCEIKHILGGIDHS